MRFAGSAIEDFMGSGPSYGEIGSAAAMNQAKQDINKIGLESQTKALGIGETAKTEAQGLILDAKGAYGAAQQQASNMSQMGGMLGNAIGGLGGLFKGSSQAAANVNAGYSPGLGIPLADFENYGYDPRG